MSDFEYTNDTKEKFKTFIDNGKIDGAYPTLNIVQDMTTEIIKDIENQRTQYITKSLESLDIDKDVLMKQKQEINRLRNLIADTYKEALCDAIHHIENADAITDNDSSFAIGVIQNMIDNI